MKSDRGLLGGVAKILRRKDKTLKPSFIASMVKPKRHYCEELEA
jgi:hypothetical protein